MFKKEELSSLNSCLSKAEEDEMIFVLLSRDACAPIAIEAWVEARIACGKNQRSDPQILEALKCAQVMRAQFLRKIAQKMKEQASG